jgi:hypothetical protein
LHGAWLRHPKLRWVLRTLQQIERRMCERTGRTNAEVEFKRLQESEIYIVFMAEQGHVEQTQQAFDS